MKTISRFLEALERIATALENLSQMERKRLEREKILKPLPPPQAPPIQQVWYGALSEEEGEKLARRIFLWREETQNWTEAPPPEVMNGNS